MVGRSKCRKTSPVSILRVMANRQAETRRRKPQRMQKYGGRFLLFTGGETGRATGTPNRGRVAVIFYPAFTAKAGSQSKLPHRPEDSGKPLTSPLEVLSGRAMSEVGMARPDRALYPHLREKQATYSAASHSPQSQGSSGASSFLALRTFTSLAGFSALGFSALVGSTSPSLRGRA